MNTINNPVLRGFNPDPSIVRVGDDYYIATSTFEWSPGVQIHHSRDLVNWRLLTHALTRKSQLDLVGNPDSGGVWAPCLSYSDGMFYLIYTDVKSHLGPYKDMHNYMVTAPDIMGPWSEPIYLNSIGFDPSLYHEADGTKWLLGLVWDHRKNRNAFGGITMQQYSPEEQRLVGKTHIIFTGTSLGLTEGPHLYKQGEYYYLLTAEGGTRFGHAATVARSRSLTGPYEADPSGPLLTTADDPSLPLQRAGHASLVQVSEDEWYIAHLCGRPLRPSMHCVLGRETAIQRVKWTEDGWLRLYDGGHHPSVQVEAPKLEQHVWEEVPAVDHFDNDKLSLHFATLRDPFHESWGSLTERQGFLRLRGRESLYSSFRQSLVARRQQSFTCTVETAVEFEPEHYQQMAGLVYYYNSKNYYYLHLTHHEEYGKCLSVISSNRADYDEPLEKVVPIHTEGAVYLRAVLDYERLTFYYSLNGQTWEAIGDALDASIISDEHAETVIDGYLMDQGFTGGFIGMCVQDLSGQGRHADFDYFVYQEHIEGKE